MYLYKNRFKNLKCKLFFFFKITAAFYSLLEPGNQLSGVFVSLPSGDGAFTIDAIDFNRAPTVITEGYMIIEVSGSSEMKGLLVPTMSIYTPAQFVLDKKLQPITQTEPG